MNVQKNVHSVPPCLYGYAVQMNARTLEFSKWLSAAMSDAGLSQSELARQSGVSKQYINGLLAAAAGRESRAKQPSVETVDALAKALRKPTTAARIAAGWAADSKPESSSEIALIAIFRNLPSGKQGDLLAFAETLFRRHSNQPGDDLEIIGEGKPSKNN